MKAARLVLVSVLCIGMLMCLIACGRDHSMQAQGAADIVYVTSSGQKFHRDGCQSLRKSKIQMTREDAIAKGYEPCKICRP